MTSINLINSLAQPLKSTVQFIAHQEQAAGLSTSRFIQDTTTCLVPKATFSRSKADLAENAFLELTQGAVMYFLPAILGDKVARKIFSRKLDKTEKKLVATPAVELLKQKNVLNPKVMPVKAAIALSAMIIPIATFALSYFKNLFTLKVFKTGDFNNIANLEDVKEDNEKHEKVRKGAYRGIIAAAAAYAGCLGSSILIAKKGNKSKLLQNLSELVLAPGSKLFKNNEKKKNFFDKYFSLDFASEKGKLALSRGQLTSCVLIGMLGYFGAAADRGKQNFLEILFRVPIIGFYVITGGEMFDRGFKKLLKKTGKCKEMIDDNLNTPRVDELEKHAKKILQQNNKPINDESVKAMYKNLAKQKALISGVPFVFGIGVMGFFIAGISNLFTRYRYNKDLEQQNATKELLAPSSKIRETFKGFSIVK